MNKRELSNFAVWAKNNLEKQIGVSLNLLGIYSATNIKTAYIKGDITIIDGSDKTYDKSFKYKRDRIVELIKNDGYDQTIEQLAYTWFNRLVALRFMEVHGYLDHGFKIFPTTTSIEPEILSNYKYLVDDLKLDIDYCNKLKQTDNIEELYRYILFKQCNALSKSLPMLFAHQYDYLELLLPTTLLKGQTIITELVKLDENDFKEDVEVIGWLYQFYISTKKDEVFASKKTITKDTLPAVTQLFTPDWIVRYMAENSVGRIWLESYPSSSLKKEFKYYVDDAEQTEEVNKQLEEIKYKNVNPEDIKIVEPCCGSGHILVYCFDLLDKMYEEKGYNKRDIPGLILKKNLVGFDVDKRAAQLASFALMMKARSIDPKFLNDDRRVSPKVFEIKDSQSLKRIDWKRKIDELNLSDWKNNPITNDEFKVLDYIVKTFEDGKVIGSLLKVKRSDQYIPLRKKIMELKKLTITPIIEPEFIEYGIDRLVELLALAYYLSFKYDVMITNPPYIGISSLEPACKKYAVENYPNSKTDMFAMFMETDFVKKNGFKALINLQNWLTGFSYTDFRKETLDKMTFLSLLHLGKNAFPEIKGEVVQTVSFILRFFKTFDFITQFIDLQNGNSLEKNLNFINKKGKVYLKQTSLFKKMPSNEYSYWIPSNLLNVFGASIKLGSVCEAKSGVMTGKDDIFTRLWFEVDIKKVSLYNNSTKSLYDGSKWFPVTNGGKNNKWYGNLELVINMKNGGEDISNYGTNTFRLRDSKYYFREACSWSTISSNTLSVRYTPENVLFGNNGPNLFCDDNKLFFIMGLLNSVVSTYICKLLNPTLSILIDDITNIPLIKVDQFQQAEIENLVLENIKITKGVFDRNEVSFNFQKNPSIEMCGLPIIDGFNKLYEFETESCETVYKNETKLNNIFTELYGLKDIIKIGNLENFENKPIDYKKSVWSLISYLIGVLMGRYSLAEEGLIYAGGTFDKSRYGTYEIDDDGIIPLYSRLGMEDNLTNKIITLIKQVYGEENYKENIDFIAEALGKKVNESSEETLNRYLCNDFYNDHLKMYQKRPIYWMFSSGKNNGFKCLIYLHRYNEDTLAKINSKYLLPETTRLKNELSDISNALTRASDQEKRSLLKLEATINDQYNEAIEYSLVMDHMANRYIKLDLDDGVKVNYAKFQGIELVKDDGAKIKKDLLVPIK